MALWSGSRFDRVEDDAVLPFFDVVDNLFLLGCLERLESWVAQRYPLPFCAREFPYKNPKKGCLFL